MVLGLAFAAVMNSPPLELLLFVLTALLYAGAGVVAAIAVRRGHRYPRLRLLLVVGGGFLLQTVALYLRGLRHGGCPLGNPFEVIQFLTWSIVLFYLVFGPTFRVSLLGLFSSALAGLLAVISLVIPAWDASRRPPMFGGNPWVEVHASMALVSYGAFGVLALISGMYLLQHRALKRKRDRPLFAFLPSIVQLDTMGGRILPIGLAGLTLALVVAFIGGIQSHLAVPVPKLVAVVLVWLVGVVFWTLRSRKILHGPRSAWGGLVLFALALLSLVPIEYAHPTQAATSGPVIRR